MVYMLGGKEVKMLEAMIMIATGASIVGALGMLVLERRRRRRRTRHDRLHGYSVRKKS